VQVLVLCVDDSLKILLEYVFRWVLEVEIIVVSGVMVCGIVVVKHSSLTFTQSVSGRGRKITQSR
jgi:hypothetical protein